MKKSFLSLLFSLLFLVTFTNNAFAAYIDSVDVYLYPGMYNNGTRLWIDSSNYVEFGVTVQSDSNHQVIYTIKDPSGNVVDQKVMNPGQINNTVYADYNPSTGYYTLILSCYGGATDCDADGHINQDSW